MERLRHTLAHGGIGLLAAIVALGYAAALFANALSAEVVSIVLQSTYEEGSGKSPFELTVAGANFDLTRIVQEGIVVVLVALALFGAWRLTTGARQTCPECQSEVPAGAAICRYCTSELREADAT